MGPSLQEERGKSEYNVRYNGVSAFIPLGNLRYAFSSFIKWNT
jgi:hypothetical protein